MSKLFDRMFGSMPRSLAVICLVAMLAVFAGMIWSIAAGDPPRQNYVILPLSGIAIVAFSVASIKGPSRER